MNSSIARYQQKPSSRSFLEFGGVADGELGGAKTDNLPALLAMDAASSASESNGNGPLKVVIPPGVYHQSAPFRLASNMQIQGTGASFTHTWIIISVGCSIDGLAVEYSPFHGFIFHRLQESKFKNLTARHCQGFGMMFGGGYRSQPAIGSLEDTVIKGNIGGVGVCVEEGGLIQYDLADNGFGPGSITSDGSGYTDGVHFVELETLTGLGENAIAKIVVVSGAVSQCEIIFSGNGYAENDTLTSTAIGGGSGFVYTVGRTIDSRSWMNAAIIERMQIRDNMRHGILGSGEKINYNRWIGLQMESNRTRERPVIDLESSQSTFDGHVVGVRTWSSDTEKRVTNATATSPVVLTVPLHGYTTGDEVVGSLFFGQGWSSLNEEDHTVTVINSNTISLDGVDGTSFPQFIAGAEVSKRFSNIVAESMTAAAKAVVTATDHGLKTGEFVQVVSASSPFQGIAGRVSSITRINDDLFRLEDISTASITGSFVSASVIRIVPDTNPDIPVAKISRASSSRNIILGRRWGNQFYLNPSSWKDIIDLGSIGGNAMLATVFGISFTTKGNYFDQLFVNDRELSFTSLQRIEIGGRIEMIAQNWVTFPSLYGSSLGNINEAAGSGADPTKSWLHSATPVRGGTTIKRLVIAGRANANDIVDYSIRIYAMTGDFDGGNVNSDAEVSHTTIYSADDVAISGTNLFHHSVDLNVSVASDAILVVYYRAGSSSTHTTTRYMVAPAYLEAEVPS